MWAPFSSLQRWYRNTSKKTRLGIAGGIASVAIVIWAVATSHIIAVVVITVLGALLALLGKNTRKAHHARQAKIAAAVGRTKWPKRLARWILDGEYAEWEERMHPVAILKWWTLAIVGPIVGIFAGIVAHSWIVFLSTALTTLGIAGWFIADWWFDWRVITNARVMEVKGIFNTRAPAAPLSAIRTVSPEEPFFSKVLERFGLPPYIHVVFETAADVESIPGLRYVRDPIKMNALLQGRFMTKTDDKA